MKLKIISYNILCDNLSTPSFYINSKTSHLDKHNRLRLLLEILDEELTNKSILCLQEVSTDIQLKNLYVFLFNKGFKVIFLGELIISFPNELVLKKINMGSFSNLLSKNASEANIKLVNSIRKYYMILYFDNFVIVNTHLISSNRELRLLQFSLLLNELDKINNKIIITGDMNIEAKDKLMNLIKYNTLNTQFGKFTVKNKYTSVYSLDADYITTHTSNRLTPAYTEMLDYILVTDNIKIESCKPLRKRDYYINNDIEVWPNDKEPSDHTLIYANIVI